MNRAVQFSAAYAALTAAHEVADHIVQVDEDAVDKGKEGAKGRVACLRHVASYTATQALALVAADRGLGLRLNWRYATAGLLVSAVTHYAADRSGGRWAEDPEKQPTTRMVRAAHRARKGGWLTRDPQAGYRIDQAWHKGWIAIAAGVVAAGGRR
ncbi:MULTISPECIES: hypothetical protein [unclassified Streptomyces]|uniref:hypothetical protein n=1 Tax=unclassified Streptomyces TaxID=2593676 RepID=UPI0008812E25|nr:MULTISPECIES: hypothetical protein [unclassified Streptomyces]PBC72312.1 hypothetical protein BX261_7396 [Streptomyces sp. 2321.6]SDR62207.1 hypothetical protein SAMN05216511_7307 [Streptomyces sp. KS_16]SEE51054.1 hypothetical protein SAMN05428940_7356 [Streptomyces sp. 2133.1]SNC77816.1 hypothetical protein SAMN06272741_7232 [Streptomyces sp. 2114.4]